MKDTLVKMKENEESCFDEAKCTKGTPNLCCSLRKKRTLVVLAKYVVRVKLLVDLLLAFFSEDGKVKCEVFNLKIESFEKCGKKMPKIFCEAGGDENAECKGQ